MLEIRILKYFEFICFKFRTIVPDDSLWNAKFCKHLLVCEVENIEKVGGIIDSHHIGLFAEFKVVCIGFHVLLSIQQYVVCVHQDMCCSC